MDCSNPCDLITANKLSHSYAHKAVGPSYETQADNKLNISKVGQSYDLQTDTKNIERYIETQKSVPIYVHANKSLSYGLNCGKIIESTYGINTQNTVDRYQHLEKIVSGYGSNGESSGRTYNTLKTVEMGYSNVNPNTSLGIVNIDIGNMKFNNGNNFTNINATNASCANTNTNYTSCKNPSTNINTTSSASTYIYTNHAVCTSSVNSYTNVATNSTGTNTITTNQCCNNENCPNNLMNAATPPVEEVKETKGKRGRKKKIKGEEQDGQEKKTKTKKTKGKRLSTPPSDPNSLLALPETRQKWSHLTLNEKAISINVYKFVKNTLYPYQSKKDIVKITADIIGVSVSTIYGILKEYKATGKVSVPPKHAPPDRSIVDKLDDATLTAIRKKVNGFYILHNKLPSLSKVLAAVNEDEDLPKFSRTTMYRILKKMNFTTSKPPKGAGKGSLVLERPNMMMLGNEYDMNSSGSSVSVIRGQDKPKKLTKKQKMQAAIAEINLSREPGPMGYR